MTIKIYLCHAMDEITHRQIGDNEKAHSGELKGIKATIINPFSAENSSNKDPDFIVENDYSRIASCDLVIVDLSREGYEHVGCYFEIYHAYNLKKPVIAIIGNKSLEKRVFLQYHCDFICRNIEEAIFYYNRVINVNGSRSQIVETCKYYESISSSYDNLSDMSNNMNSDDYAKFTSENAFLRDKAKEYSSGNVLQVGVGTGKWTKTLCESANHVFGLDQSPSMVDLAEAKLKDFLNVKIENVDFLKFNSDNKFDCVFLFFIFGLLPPLYQDLFIKKAATFLKKRGLLFIAESKSPRDFKSIGLGRRKLQQREFSSGDPCTIYKEHFTGNILSNKLSCFGLENVEHDSCSKYFAWAVSKRVE
jgi:ubiquinone/menaquinone biosynthesis C-methylase UbiE